jgi:hypothetical protein
MNKCFSDVSSEDIHIHSVVAMLMRILLLDDSKSAQLTVEFGINPTYRHIRTSIEPAGTAAICHHRTIHLAERCYPPTLLFHQKYVVRINRVYW